MIKHSKLTKHHVFPRSRCKRLGIKANREGNVVMVENREHQLYHALFGNRTPEEIMDYLLTHFWDGKISVDDF